MMAALARAAFMTRFQCQLLSLCDLDPSSICQAALKPGSSGFDYLLNTANGYATQATSVPRATISPATVTHAPTAFVPCFFLFYPVEPFLYVSMNVHPCTIYLSRRNTIISHLNLYL
jgi:hypothetical protein